MPAQFLRGQGEFTVYVSAARRPAPPPPPAPTPQQLAFPIEAGGYGCVVETAGPADAGLSALLSAMRELTRQPLVGLSARWGFLNQTMVPIAPTRPAAAPPSGMVLVPRGRFHFSVRGVEIEGDNDARWDGRGVDVQYPWEAQPQRSHAHDMDLGPFYIDRFPVTGRTTPLTSRRPGTVPKTRTTG